MSLRTVIVCDRCGTEFDRDPKVRRRDQGWVTVYPERGDDAWPFRRHFCLDCLSYDEAERVAAHESRLAEYGMPDEWEEGEH